MTIASDQSQVCLDAVSACEILLRETGNKKRLSQPIIKLLDECAHICMGTFYAIQSVSVNASSLALLCMGICEECAEACDLFNDALFKQCAQACRYCSFIMYDLAIESPES